MYPEQSGSVLHILYSTPMLFATSIYDFVVRTRFRLTSQARSLAMQASITYF